VGARLAAEHIRKPNIEAVHWNVQYILSSKLQELKDEIRSYIDGGSAKYPLQNLFYHIASDFKRSLAPIKPIVKLPADIDNIVCKFDGGDDDGECIVISVQLSPKRKRRASG